MQFLALGGIAGPIVFVLVTLICASLRPGFDHMTQFISELGANGTAYAALMNYAGFVPTGIFFVSFAIALGVTVAPSRLGLLSALLLALFGTGVITAGIMSCDAGCPIRGASTEAVIHDRVSVLSFLAAIVAAGLLGFFARGRAEWGRLWIYCFASSATALLFLGLMGRSLESGALTGLWQRLLLMVLFSWCAVVGLHVSRLARAGIPPRGA